jgi:hypothetical protein
MPGPKMKPARGGWVYVGRDDAELLIGSLIEQLEGPLPRRASRPKKRKAKSASIEAVEPAAIYQLKITLMGTRPAVWRRIQAPGDIRLSRLHAVLQIVMGWTNSHLHGFRADGRNYGVPGPEFDGMMEMLDERQARLDEIAPRVKSHIIYEYDFGDSWEHMIVVEKIFAPDSNVQYPHCLAGKRACPPDDVGGVWGYADFLKAIRNSRHPEHDEMLEWAGGAFDPTAFDLRGVNGMLELFEYAMAPRATRR